VGDATGRSLPYHQVKKAIDIANQIGNDAPEQIVRSLGHSMQNMLVGREDIARFKEEAGELGLGLDPTNVKVGILPALKKAHDAGHDGADDAAKFVQAAIDLMDAALTAPTSSAGYHEMVRRAARVASNLLAASLAALP